MIYSTIEIKLSTYSKKTTTATTIKKEKMSDGYILRKLVSVTMTTMWFFWKL